MVGKTYIVESRITEKIYRAYMNFHVYKRDRSWLWLPCFSAGLLVFGIMNLLNKSPFLGWMFVALAVYLLISRFLRFYLGVGKMAETYGLCKVPKLFYTIRMNPTAITIDNKKEHAEYHWDQVYQVYLLDQIIYLYMNKQTAFLLPIDCITADGISINQIEINDFFHQVLDPEKIIERTSTSKI